MAGKKPFYRSPAFHLSLGLSISLLCLWWAMRPILNEPGGLAKVGAAFREADYRTIPAILLTLFLFYSLKAWRWRLMLWPVGHYRPLRDLLGPIMIGFAMNNVLPARLGEVIRCFVLSRQQRLPFTVSLASVALERIFDGITIVIYFAIGLLFIQGVDPAVERSAMVFAAGAFTVAIGGLGYVLWTRPFLNVVEGILRRLWFLPEGLRSKVIAVLEAGAQGLSSLKDIRLLLGILVISIVKWGLNGFLVWISLWSFGIVVSPLVAMVLLGIVAFAVAVPAGPGFFGVIQACFMTLPRLTGRDLNPATVFAASIYFHLSQYIPVTLVGLGYFVRSGLTLQQVERIQAPESVEPTLPGTED